MLRPPKTASGLRFFWAAWVAQHALDLPEDVAPSSSITWLRAALRKGLRGSEIDTYRALGWPWPAPVGTIRQVVESGLANRVVRDLEPLGWTFKELRLLAPAIVEWVHSNNAPVEFFERAFGPNVRSALRIIGLSRYPTARLARWTGIVLGMDYDELVGIFQHWPEDPYACKDKPTAREMVELEALEAELGLPIRP